MITITHGDTIMQPVLVLDGYESRRRVGNVVHRILGRNDPDITFHPAGLRTGQLQLFFLAAAPAIECESHHAMAGSFRLVDDDVPDAGMDYVPAEGEIGTRRDPQTGRYIVTVPFQEVLL